MATGSWARSRSRRQAHPSSHYLGTDANWLQFFTEEELASLDEEIRTQVMPRIVDLIGDELSAISDAAHDPSEQLFATLDALDERFPGWDDEIHAARELVNDHRLSHDDYRPVDSERRLTSKPEEAVSMRTSKGRSDAAR